FLQPTRSEEGVDLERLPFDGVADRRVVHQHDAMLELLQPLERRLELERLLNGFVDEVLDDPFPPRTERATTEATAEAANAGEPNPTEFEGIAVEQVNARVREDFRHLLLLARFEVVIPEDTDD